MPAKLKVFLPGEKTAVLLTAAVIGLLAGACSILFRETLELVHRLLFVQGYALLRVGEGGWRSLLLPLRRRS